MSDSTDFYAVEGSSLSALLASLRANGPSDGHGTWAANTAWVFRWSYQPVTDVGYVSVMAWLYHTDVGFVGGLQQHVEAADLRNPNLPKVLFKPLTSGGWSVLPWHTRQYQVARCHGLHATYVFTPQHPGGVLIRH